MALDRCTLVLWLIAAIYCETYTLPVLFFGDGFVDENTPLTPITIAALQAQSAIKMAVVDVNNNPNLLPNIELKVDFRFYGSGSFVRVIGEMINASENNETLVLGNFDGRDHYVCATGGFTGEPGGIIFFSIFLAYGALVLLAGAYLSVVTRKLPSAYNESTLIAISIYNLGFLSVVIFPVFLVLRMYNPFLAWIIRTIAILYAITATMVLQFAPKLIGIVFVDRFKNSQQFISTTAN